MTTQAGIKHDHGKAPMLRGALMYFPRALSAVAQVSAFGAAKYTWRGWVSVPDGVDRYGDALVRHLAEGDGRDSESELLHAAHVAWNALARLELLLAAEAKAAEVKAEGYPGLAR